MDDIDRRLLQSIQKGLTLTSRPYLQLGEQLGISENEVIVRLEMLKAEGLIRRLGAVFDSKALGYVSALCAIKAMDNEIEYLASIVNEYPGVTHNYQREHPTLKLWFTLTCASDEVFTNTISELQKRLGRKVHCYPAIRGYKIKFYLPFT